jgi:hypothetical protein
MPAAFTGQTTVGTTAVQLSATALPSTCGIGIASLSANTGKIFYGFSSAVTTATGKEIIAPGAFVPAAQVGDGSGIWLISDTAGQGVSYTGY